MDLGRFSLKNVNYADLIDAATRSVVQVLATYGLLNDSAHQYQSHLILRMFLNKEMAETDGRPAMSVIVSASVFDLELPTIPNEPLSDETCKRLDIMLDSIFPSEATQLYAPNIDLYDLTFFEVS